MPKFSTVSKVQQGGLNAKLQSLEVQAMVQLFPIVWHRLPVIYKKCIETTPIWWEFVPSFVPVEVL